MLHGEKKSSLDRKARVRIAIGAAHGIAHIHEQDNQKLVHGNIKSSNIFLNKLKYGCVADAGLAAVTSPVTFPSVKSASEISEISNFVMTAGYRAPEDTGTRTLTQASDIYSYGVLLLELISGKRPLLIEDSGKVIMLVERIESIYREWTSEVFADELLEHDQMAMFQVLHVALYCVHKQPEQRPRMAFVVKMLEEIIGIHQEDILPSARNFPKCDEARRFQDLARIKVDVVSWKKQESDLVVLFEGSPFAFSLWDLLMAPSCYLEDDMEIVGQRYAVSLRDGVLIAKRFTCTKFDEQMKRIASVEHDNIVRIRGYYPLSKNEHLMFYDYYPKGSVYTMLYGKREENRTELDWESRMKIAIGVAKGLAHIHEQDILHGNIKSANIFLNSQGYGCLADFGLECVLVTATGYDPPEFSISSLICFSYESDVYSFGVLLLELIRGTSAWYRKDFVYYTRGIVRDDWTTLVFDAKLRENPIAEREMREMAAIALSCVENEPEMRPKMKDVVKMIELTLQSSNS